MQENTHSHTHVHKECQVMFEAIQGDDKIDDEQHSDHNRCLMISFKYSILCTLQAHVVIAFEKCGKCCFNDYKRLI